MEINNYINNHKIKYKCNKINFDINILLQNMCSNSTFNLFINLIIKNNIDLFNYTNGCLNIKDINKLKYSCNETKIIIIKKASDKILLLSNLNDWIDTKNKIQKITTDLSCNLKEIYLINEMLNNVFNNISLQNMFYKSKKKEIIEEFKN
jgi:hypothetical protein